MARGVTAWARLRAHATRAAAIVRRVLGAPDYDAYVTHLRAHHAGTTPMSREQFVTVRLDERYSKPGAKCC